MIQVRVSFILAFILTSLQSLCQTAGAGVEAGTEMSPSKGNSTLSMLSQSVSARFLLSRKHDKVWTAAISYKNLLTQNNTSVINDLWLHSVGVSFSYRTKTSDKTTMTITVQPSIWSDFKDISGEDFRFSTSVRFITKKDNHFSIGWGIIYSYQFFGNQIVPIIDLSYRMNTGNWRIGGALPFRPRIEYAFNNSTAIGFRLEGNYYSYRLTPQLNSQYLFYRQWDAGLFIDQKISGKLYITAGAGYAFNRSLQIFDKDQTVPLSFFGNRVAKKYTPSYSNQSDGMVYKVGIQLRLFKEE